MARCGTSRRRRSHHPRSRGLTHPRGRWHRSNTTRRWPRTTSSRRGFLRWSMSGDRRSCGGGNLTGGQTRSSWRAAAQPVVLACISYCLRPPPPYAHRNGQFGRAQQKCHQELAAQTLPTEHCGFGAAADSQPLKRATVHSLGLRREWLKQVSASAQPHPNLPRLLQAAVQGRLMLACVGQAIAAPTCK
jgi:hypothetical protein